jgi:hypothetical protein
MRIAINFKIRPSKDIVTQWMIYPFKEDGENYEAGYRMDTISLYPRPLRKMFSDYSDTLNRIGGSAHNPRMKPDIIDYLSNMGWEPDYVESYSDGYMVENIYLLNDEDDQERFIDDIRSYFSDKLPTLKNIKTFEKLVTSIDMIYLKTFEKFFTKEERQEYYRAKAAAVPKEQRLIDYKDLDKYRVPEEIKQKMKDWSVIYKSPFSNSFYSSMDVDWSHKPDKSYRVSNHWNFKTNRGNNIHCQTDAPVSNDSHISLGQWDQDSKKYHILITLPSQEYLDKIELTKKKKDYFCDPKNIEIYKSFKNRISNKEIIGEVIDGKKYKGIVRKYTGRELKLEDENGNLIYNNNYLNNQTVNLFDREGNIIKNLYNLIIF